MKFTSSFDEIQTLLTQNEEFVRIKEEEDNFPLDSFFDMRVVLKRINAAGSWIDQGALSELRRSLKTINAIVFFFQHNEEKLMKYPHLMILAENIVTIPDITKKIALMIDNYGQVEDNASQSLSSIRRELTRTMGSITGSL